MSSGLFRADMPRVILEALILSIVAFAVGLSVNFSLVFNAFSGKSVAPAVSEQALSQRPEDSSAETELLPFPVMLEELDSLLADGAVLVDARSRSAYEKAHLQGAVSLPLGDAEDGIAALQDQFSAATTLIIYCSGFGCPDSFDLGVLLLKAGYRDVLVYEGGFPEWQDAGRPVDGKGR